MMELSEDDLALINVLQIAPRLSWADAAQVLGVHATTLAARWERLRASGVVLDHRPPDRRPAADVPGVRRCGLRNAPARDEVTAALAAMPEIVTVEEAASNRDLMLTVITPIPGRVQPEGHLRG